MAVCQNLVPLVNIKIAGKWMFIPLKMVLIGIDPYPYLFHSLHLVPKMSPLCWSSDDLQVIFPIFLGHRLSYGNGTERWAPALMFVGLYCVYIYINVYVYISMVHPNPTSPSLFHILLVNLHQIPKQPTSTGGYIPLYPILSHPNIS